MRIIKDIIFNIIIIQLIFNTKARHRLASHALVYGATLASLTPFAQPLARLLGAKIIFFEKIQKIIFRANEPGAQPRGRERERRACGEL